MRTPSQTSVATAALQLVLTDRAALSDFENVEDWGADHIPSRGEALLPSLGSKSAAELLDAISEAIADRPALHSEQMEGVITGSMSVVQPVLGTEVARKLCTLPMPPRFA